MRSLVLSAVIGSARQVLAIFIAMVAIAGPAYLGTHKLSNPDHYAYGVCPWSGTIEHGYLRSCSPPTRFAWQIPLALVIGIGGVGAAVALTTKRRPGGPGERRALRV
jgi:hypothetical protein